MSSILSEFSSEVGQLIIMSILKEAGREAPDIRAKLWELSDGSFHLENGKLASYLYLMEQKGWIESWWDTANLLGGDRAKRYKLTSAGKNRLEEKYIAWNQLKKIMEKFDDLPEAIPTK